MAVKFQEEIPQKKLESKILSSPVQESGLPEFACIHFIFQGRIKGNVCNYPNCCDCGRNADLTTAAITPPLLSSLHWLCFST
ncbi:uncharacterized protein LOC108938987 isoform X3 [Scleropages formosus]|uniref:uncharacterized protein LOC108938987 isoform X3 n=1 Tax=Scleropages formosus TaxID=113540 RepID=UPI000878573A|nr:uncharacterized protein LOC108938987 isoform X3 [Scleropages formosus]